MSESAIRLIAAVAALIIMSIGLAHAQTVQKVEIYEFGTYTAGPEIQIGFTRQGLRQCVVDYIDLVQATDTIIARIGAEFGFRFRVIGKAHGTPVRVTVVTRFPPPGLLAPDGTVPFLVDDESWAVNVGENSFLSWPFERRSDLVPGIWTFEIWIDGRKYAEQKFNIILPPIANRQSPALPGSGKVG